MIKNIGILGYGWLGLSLAKHLIDKGYQVKGTTTSLEKANQLESQGFPTFLLDLQDNKIDQIDAFLQGLDLLIITIPPHRGEAFPTYKTNFDKLIPFLHKHNIKKTMMMSSVSVYAAQQELVTEENTNYSSEPTAQQIIAAEKTLIEDKSFATCILRLGGLFGNDRHPVRYICAREVLDNPNLPVNMIHNDDIIAYTLALIASSWENSTLYNIVCPLYKNRQDYYSTYAASQGLTLPQLGHDDLTTYRKVDGSKIAKETGIDYTF